MVAHQPCAANALAATIARLRERDPYAVALVLDRTALGDGWVTAADLCAPEMPYLDQILDGVAAQYAAGERRIAGTFFAGWYAYYVFSAAIGCYLAEQRAPVLDLTMVAVRIAPSATARLFEVGLLEPGLVGLRDDPAATSLALPDRAALFAYLRQATEEHLSVFIEALAVRTGLGERALWNIAADACAELFLHHGVILDCADAACAEGLAFVRAEASPMAKSKTAYTTITVGGTSKTFRLRGGCCLFYKTAAARHCDTCVLLEPSEREERLRAHVASA